MESFELHIPTRVFFGRDAVEKLPQVLPEGASRILLSYGGGSIKRSGLYDRVMAQLGGREVFELGGIGSNPKLTTVYEGLDICKRNGVEAIVAVGGGSVIDCSKVIAAAMLYDGDAWDMIISRELVKNALPLIAVPTMAATGTETNTSAVVVNGELGLKISLYGIGIAPRAALMDPSNTFSVPPRQTAAGCADIMSHIMEPYFAEPNPYLLDVMAEGAMKTVVRYARVAMDEPDSYEARSQIFWASEIGDNGILFAGNRPTAYGVHHMEHEISGHFNTTHGEGLAVLTPVWMEYVLSENTAPRFARFGREVFGVGAGLSDTDAARAAIAALRGFFRSLDLPATLGEMGVSPATLKELAESAEARGTEKAWVPLYAADILEIYKMSM